MLINEIYPKKWCDLCFSITNICNVKSDVSVILLAGIIPSVGKIWSAGNFNHDFTVFHNFDCSRSSNMCSLSSLLSSVQRNHSN